MKSTINILVTVDTNYIPPLKVMLYSLFSNNPGESFNIHLIYSQIDEAGIAEIREYIDRFGQEFAPLRVGDGFLADAPVTSYYSTAMYYRLLASSILPQDLDKILYMDPDILIINPIRPLADTDVSGHFFAACAHNSPIVDGINKVRLQSGADRYFNSGVLLMNLERQRGEIKPGEIFEYITENENVLVLPDQDVLNGLYGDRTLLLDDSLYNYDARKSRSYYLMSGGVKDTDWVVNNTVVLHFCGKQKPWNSSFYSNKFALLYKHYRRRSMSV